MRLCALFLLILMTTAALPSAAAPWTRQQIINTYPGVEQNAQAVNFSLGGKRALALFDEDGRIAALITDRAMPSYPAAEWGLQDADIAEEGGLNFIVSESLLQQASKRPLGQTPLGTLACFFRQDNYHADELKKDGRILWVTGNRRSLDLLVPLVQDTPVTCIEIVATVEINEFAANVLAQKLGYPKDNSSEREKRALARKLRCGHIHYYNSKRRVLIYTKAGKSYIAEQEGATPTEYPELHFPAITRRVTLPTAHNRETEQHPTARSHPKQPEISPLMSPTEALKAYMNKLRSL